MNAILKILISAAEGPLIQSGVAGVEGFLQKEYEKKPKAVEALVSVAHDLLQGFAIDVAAKTAGTNIDDDVVAAAIKELETFATEKGFTLAKFD